MTNQDFKKQVLGFVEDQKVFNNKMIHFIAGQEAFNKKVLGFVEAQVVFNEEMRELKVEMNEFKLETQQNFNLVNGRLNKLDHKLGTFIQDQTEENFRIHTRVDGVRLSLENKMDEFIAAQMAQNQCVEDRFTLR